MNGKLIVFEGVDGSGCGTQSEILREKLNAKLLKPVLFLKYPDYNDPLGESIHMFLHGKIALEAKTQFLLYVLNMVKDMFIIKEALKSGRNVVVDRYFLSTLVYQGLQGFPLEKALEFAEMFDIIKPDFVLYLKIDPKTGFERKKKEKSELDKWEKNLNFQKKVVKGYDELARKKIFCKKWFVIDGGKSVDEVSKDIWNIVKKKELRIK